MSIFYFGILFLFLLLLLLKKISDRLSKEQSSEIKRIGLEISHGNDTDQEYPLPAIDENLPYLKKTYLLTRAEKEFFDILSKIVGTHYLLFAKVRMADLFLLPSMDNRSYYHYFGKIKSKHIDFLLCDNKSVEPVLAIELDDSSHSREDRILRDEFVDKLFKTSNFPILHIRVAANYNEADLLNQIRSLIKVDELNELPSVR